MGKRFPSLLPQFGSFILKRKYQDLLSQWDLSGRGNCGYTMEPFSQTIPPLEQNVTEKKKKRWDSYQVPRQLHSSERHKHCNFSMETERSLKFAIQNGPKPVWSDQQDWATFGCCYGAFMCKLSHEQCNNKDQNNNRGFHLASLICSWMWWDVMRRYCQPRVSSYEGHWVHH